VPRESFLRSSDAAIQFTWSFLRAYNTLAVSLRQSGSALSVGLAALVASENLYPSSLGRLPVQLHEPAAIANILILEEPSLLDASFGLGSERSTLIRKALRVACVGESEGLLERLINRPWGPLQPATKPNQTDLHLADFLPANEGCRLRLVDTASEEVKNLTVRSLIIGALASSSRDPSVLNCRPGAGCPFGTLLEDIKQEMAVRGTPALAPTYRGGKESLIKTDPTILIPLLRAAYPSALSAVAKSIGPQREATLSAQDPAALQRLKDAILGALKANAITAKILKLAGSDPDLAAQADPRPGHIFLVWKNMVRRVPLPGEVAVSEQVSVEVVDRVPSSDGPYELAGGNDQQSGLPGVGIPSNSKDLGSSRGTGGAIGAGFGPGPGNANSGHSTPVSPTPGLSNIALPDAASDKIQVPEDGMRELQRRQRELRDLAEKEFPQLVQPSETDILRFVIADKELRTLDPSGWVEHWNDLRAEREKFLDEREYSLLKQLLVRELLTATWLRGAGAPKTADLLLLDLMELSVYAGCEPNKGIERLGSDTSLAMMLHAPSLVYQELDSNERKVMRLGQPALDAASNWAKKYEFGLVVRGHDLSLEKLFGFWQSKGGGRRPYWDKIPVHGSSAVRTDNQVHDWDDWQFRLVW
ncbi:MAG TPA: hypothetical protein VI386_27135, partial [Candidatus Sulfotelmatobacter sp.]